MAESDRPDLWIAPTEQPRADESWLHGENVLPRESGPEQIRRELQLMESRIMTCFEKQDAMLVHLMGLQSSGGADAKGKEPLDLASTKESLERGPDSMVKSIEIETDLTKECDMDMKRTSMNSLASMSSLATSNERKIELECMNSLATSTRQQEQQHQHKALKQAQLSRSATVDKGLDQPRGIRETVRWIMERKETEVFFLFVILTNTIVVGIEVEARSMLPLNEIPEAFEGINLVFTILFNVELILKIFGLGVKRVFTGPDWRWNMFDLFIVLSADVEIIMGVIPGQQEHPQDDSVSLTHVRLLRILRVARVMRGIRVIRLLRFFSSLRALLLSIVNTLKSLVWTMLLIVVLSFSTGVAFTLIISDHCRDEAISRSGNINAAPVCPDSLREHWESLPSCMFTLFKVITGGLDWDHAVHPLHDVSIFLVLGFVFYVGFMFFAVLNVVTGIFCQTAIESANADKELAVMTQLQNQKQYATAIRQIFREIDEDGSDEITIDEFEHTLKDEKMAAYFASVDIDVSDVWTLFSLIDGDRSGCIDIEEFVAGCIQLKGAAKAVHMAKISYEQKIARHMLLVLESQFSELRQATLEIRDGLVKSP